LARKTDSVTFDGFQVGALAARVLVERGHRDILFVPKYDFDHSAPQGTDPRIEDPTSTERRTGVQQELAKHSEVTCWPVLPYINTPNTHLHLSRDLLLDLERLIAH